jgi:hypothetical protein
MSEECTCHKDDNGTRTCRACSGEGSDLTKIVADLRQLADQMEDVGVRMEYYGGLGPMVRHGREMIGAAGTARTWAAEIERGNTDE